MNPLEFYLFILNQGFEYDKDNTKELRFANDENFLQVLQEEGINVLNEHGKIVIESKNLPFSFFEDKIEFKEQSNLTSLKKTIIIKNYHENRSSYFSDFDFSEFENDQISKPATCDYFFINAKTFIHSKEFFRIQANLPIGSYDFVDDFSISSRSITFSSVIDKKKVKFHFPPSGVIDLEDNVDYSIFFQYFINLFEENKQYSVFLKKSIIKFLYNEKNSYEEFFRNLTKICEEAKINFNVFIHELSIDKIKVEYKEYKQKYFNSQNEILSKITTQIVALPISITGLVFGIDKLFDNYIALYIVCFGLLAYIGYITFLVKIYSIDLYHLKSQTLHDFRLLRDHAFFESLPDELEYFEKIKNALISRFSELYFLLKLFIVIIWVSSSFILVFTISKFIDFQNLSQVIIISIFIAATFGFIHSNILFKKNAGLE